MSVRARAAFEADLPVVTPYRLDLTATVLRRFSTNVVDRWDADRSYRRALDGFATPVVARVRQDAPDAVHVTLDAAPGEENRALALVRRMLGVERRLDTWDDGAARVPWLASLAARMRGVKPPRYPTLWEACVNAIVFQQISLAAASAILRRLVERIGTAVPDAGETLYAFPGPDVILATPVERLRETGLSVAKVAALRDVAEALLSGTLDEAMLEERDSAAAATLLAERRGIGPWTAAVILLRGLGRLDVFPQNDSGAARSLLALGGGVPVDVDAALHALGAQRGVLYYHLLLARLEARGELG